MTRIDNMRTIRAARGTALSAKSWLTEAPLRMLMNNLDPDVAERPGDLVVYGGIGRAARDWDSFDRICHALRRLENDQSLLVQSGKPVGVFRTHADAPRVLIANSNLVPHWATWEHFHELDRKGLMMYGQMTAGSWIYIGAQGIVQGTYETFVEAGRQHYDGDLSGRWILTAGLGGMGGAQPLAAVMAGASCLAIECQPSRIEMRLRTGYLDRSTDNLDEALALIDASCKQPRADLGRAAGQRRRRAAGAAAARRPTRHPDRPDLGARSHQRLSAARLDRGGMGRPPRPRSARRWKPPRDARWPTMSVRHAAIPSHGRADCRLRQQHPPACEGGRCRRRLRLSGLRAGLYPPAVLPRHWPVPLGGACRATPRTFTAPMRR